ncbi:MAG: hypothetical protein NC344_04220 [Bacteroidales bacterium]|nr:hypothetical protein [Bacteroidales bacterium]MCM1147034.1 hypothetical protein [Bacteroidales bacterium]MCM1205833.1 hypothetical protein [Bacillota bacterium]MCM1509925.1 hypothetical protein [Clostridium sp.]
MEKNRLYLLSFADTRYKASLERLEAYTRKFPFDKRLFLTEKDLSKEYLKKLKPWLYRRGYGYWAWKSYIVYQQLKKMNEGDILFYSDGGLYWNDKPTALKRFSEYVGLLSDKTDILAFEEDQPEYKWTKGDVFQELGVYDNDRICNSRQLLGGLWAIKKTVATVAFVKQWMELSDIEKELVTDKKSIKPNKEGFVEHRHDQSIFSVMVKRVPHIAISSSEISRELAEKGLLDEFPIQALRMKEQGRPWNIVLKNKLMRPWRMILNVYFRKIRGYHFAIGSYPW